MNRINTTSRLVGVVFVGMMIAAVDTHAQSFLTNGLVAYYPFNGNANDARGNGLNGTVYSAALAPDRFGNANSAYSFTGSSSCYISVASTAALNLTTNLSIAFWMNRTPISGGGIIICKGDAEQAYSVGTDGIGNISFNRQNAVEMCNTAGGSPTNVWIQVVCTLNGTNASVYLNGQLRTNGTGVTLGTGTGALTMGTIRSGTPVSYSGSLDDMRIYNRALSSTEVAQLYSIESSTLNVQKAVYLNTYGLCVTSNYQLQVSQNLVNWTNYGNMFTATNNYWQSTNYWQVPDWNQLFFRVVPQ